MNVMREFPVSVSPRPPRRLARRGLVLLAAMGLLVSACSSGDEQSSPGAPVDTETTAPVAGAVENAVGSGAVCYGWPNGTTDVQPCAVGLKGPGGGRVFYDAGSAQPWGRFLEVAPQNWGGTLYDCSSLSFSCGHAGGVTQQTSDAVSTTDPYYPCRTAKAAVLLPGEAGDTLWEIGGGRRNTEVLLQAAGCVDGTTSALQLVTEYRVRSGRSDWHLPSGGELTELCKYEGRNAIGGFVNQEYVSSTVGPKNGYTNFFAVDFADSCTRTDLLDQVCDQGDCFDSLYDYDEYLDGRAVRPIRAFA